MHNDQEIKNLDEETNVEPLKESSLMAPLLVIVAAVAVTAGGVYLYRSGEEQRQLVSKTQAQCVVVADELDGNTTEGGTYIKKENSYDLNEADSWGNAIHVNYSKGGFMEILKVTSAGPDGQRGSKDDIVIERKSANLSGVGSGVRDNIGETIKNATKGFKEGMKDDDDG